MISSGLLVVSRADDGRPMNDPLLFFGHCGQALAESSIHPTESLTSMGCHSERVFFYEKCCPVIQARNGLLM